MIAQNLEFHNVAELWKAPGLDGMVLSRYPLALRHRMNERGRVVSGESTGCEIRFVTTAPKVRLYLSCLDLGEYDECAVRVYRGDFEVKTGCYRLRAGRVATLTLETPERFTEVRPEVTAHGRFSPTVWRVCFGRAPVVYCGMESYGHEVRPPRAEEKPRLRYLAYGSSITHSNPDGYPLTAARRLGLDALNLGLSGACHAENAVADWLASRDDWDIMTLEIGINILWMDPAEYEQRVKYMLAKIRNAHSGKPIAAITVFPCHNSFLTNPNQMTVNHDAFNRIFRELAGRYDVTVIEGTELMDDLNCLTSDLVHPSVYGHAVMGLNLATRLKPLLPR